MNVFEAVKQSIRTREAAEHYGIEVKRNGMACCPFHDDRTPSLKLDHRFHCFGCGADGDVIDFAARLYNLSPKEAAQKLAQDFGLLYDSQAPPKKTYIRQKSEAQKFKETKQWCFRTLADYAHLMRGWETNLSPRTPDEELHPLFVEALHRKDYVEYLLDFLMDGDMEEQKTWIAEHTTKIIDLERRNKKMAEKPTNRERLREITEGIEQNIKELFESEKYMRYLSVMSRFHRYSVNNTMLIYMQKPDATLVAGYNKWKNQFERHVKKGERGITIIAPTPYKKKIEEQKLDPDTHAPMLDANGKVVMEEKEVEIPLFRPVKVFDVSQTDGKPLPSLAADLFGNVQHFEAFMEALKRSAPVPIAFEEMSADTDGYFSSSQQRIAIRQGMSEVQTVSAAVHEIAHSKLHNYQKEQETAAGTDAMTAPKPKDRHTEEVEAESISYAVCQYYGIQTGENSFGYIANWSQGKELKELRASLETINKTAGVLIADIDRHFKDICKERGIDLESEPEQEAGTETIQPESQQPESSQTIQENQETVPDPEPSWKIPTELPERDPAMFRYYITQDSLDVGTYPLMDGKNITELASPVKVEQDSITVFGCIDYPQPLTAEQERDYALLPASENPPVQDTSIGHAAEAAQLPDAPEQTLDEYPMPDPVLREDDLKNCGYQDGDLLPLSKERALELFEQDLTVYAVVDGGSAEMLFDREEFETQLPGTVFALSREEWEESPAFDALVQDRKNHQQEREQAFLSHEGDCFAIYQVKDDDSLREIRFEGLEWLKSIGREVERENYDLIYTAPLSGKDAPEVVAEQLFYRFNNEHPKDYHSPSMSVSDIVAIRKDGALSCHYCDSFGFQQITGFLDANPLKNAEMAMEDDYGMIDGIINNGPKEPTVAQLEQQAMSGQPISLMDLAAAAHREERDKRKSVVEQLHQQPKQESKKTAPKKSAEREL
ncbi:YodL domain-containing protein [Lachnospiraceae bacterium 50-23]